MANSLYTRILASIGIILSCYALYVEHKTSESHGNSEEAFTDTNGVGGDDIFAPVEESEFKALCDIEAIGASCSTVFSLPEGRMLSYFGIVPDGSVLDVPNALLGLLYYSAIFIRAQLLPDTQVMNQWTMVLNAAAMCSSVWLATKLIILKELCILCWTTHLLNLLLLLHYSKKVMKGSTKAKQA